MIIVPCGSAEKLAVKGDCGSGAQFCLRLRGILLRGRKGTAEVKMRTGKPYRELLPAYLRTRDVSTAGWS